MLRAKCSWKRVQQVFVTMVGHIVMMMQYKSHLQQYEYRRRNEKQSASCRASLHVFALQCRIPAVHCVTPSVVILQSFLYILSPFIIAMKIEYNIQYGRDVFCGFPPVQASMWKKPTRSRHARRLLLTNRIHVFYASAAQLTLAPLFVRLVRMFLQEF